MMRYDRLSQIRDSPPIPRCAYREPVAALAEAANFPKHRLHFFWSIYNAARQARAGNPIRRRRSNDLLLEKPLHHHIRFHSLHIKADDSATKILVSRCVELNVWHSRKSLLHLAVQFVNARSDSGWSNALVKANRFLQCPVMLESLKTSR